MIRSKGIGRLIPPSEERGCALVRALFLRLLAVVYLIAFSSLWVQIHGLVGSRGILPVREYLERAGSLLGDAAWLRVPTLCWLGSGDAALDVQCGLGVALALTLLAGAAPAVCAAGLWALYLSLFTAGQIFLSFQWDLLLLETGFLAILWSPAAWRPQWVWTAPSRAVLWLLRWLQFRLMFSSGFVKLASGDASWRDLRALDFHYETQPLPSWTSWYAHNLPEWFHSGEVLATFAIELVAPFAIFAGCRARLGAAAAFALLQVVIVATGNYGFFNLLVLLLCVPMLDDGIFKRFVPGALVPPTGASQPGPRPGPHRRHFPWEYLVPPLILLLLLLSSMQLAATVGLPVSRPSFLAETRRSLAPFRLANSYGLFAVMTTERPEIVVEGSMDGEDWQAYEFQWKPGDPGRAPGSVAPHMPRLDWQMWFAALRTYQGAPWFERMVARLLQGSPEVTALIESSPFPYPRFVRALLYDYRFTDRKERGESGNWWRRRLLGAYSPVLFLRQPRTESSIVENQSRP